LNEIFNKKSITIEDFREKGIIKNKEMIKILGDGNIKDSIKLEVNAISQSARKKIEKAGGEIIIKES
jgi:large subunit ribosomal protein L15